MDNTQNQPLPPGVGTWPQATPSHQPQCHADLQSYHPLDARPDNASANSSGSAANIESAVQEAVLHAQVFIYPFSELQLCFCLIDLW
jgi:polyglutamine-binding protein 1